MSRCYGKVRLVYGRMGLVMMIGNWFDLVR